MWVSILGYAAAASVLATFCMTTMVPLRLVALGSNVLFATFGMIAQIYPVAILHLILLPVNAIRLWQNWRLAKAMSTAERGVIPIESFLPFMSRRTFKAGELLTVQGGRADRMFYLVEGQVRINEINKIIGSGDVVGEIGVFAPDKTRIATAECLTDCVTFELTDAKAKEIFFQNPAFGYALVRIIISRLTEKTSTRFVTERSSAGEQLRDSVPAIAKYTPRKIGAYGRR
jgi:hypothetical protein